MPVVENGAPIENAFDPRPSRRLLLIDVTAFLACVQAVVEAATRVIRAEQIARLLATPDLVEHYRSKKTGRRVLAEFEEFQHPHEFITAIKLTEVGFDVVFAPKGMFKTAAKKFDVFLLRDFTLLKADLKSVSSQNADSIADRIVSGRMQAERLVVDVQPHIRRRVLIDGLQSGMMGRNGHKEILLFWGQKYYRLPKALILSRRIFNVIKKRAGYT